MDEKIEDEWKPKRDTRAVKLGEHGIKPPTIPLLDESTRATLAPQTRENGESKEDDRSLFGKETLIL